MQDQLFTSHGKPRTYKAKRKTDNTNLMRRYHTDDTVRQRMQASARRRHYLRTYGITETDYERMLKEQGGTCAVCNGPPTARTPKSEPRLHVDHCHTNGHVRGLLCGNCNSALGHAKDDVDRLRALISYLQRDRF